ncbi:MAG TPA: universal stress protein [Solirubrobacteraceae bacterium]
MVSGPILIAYDGSEASAHAVRESGALLGGRQAVVVVVWEADAAYQVSAVAMGGFTPAPVTVDVRTAVEREHALYEGAQQTAQQGAELAREAGFDAQPLVVADELTVPDTIVRVADERDAQAIVVGASGRSGLSELLLGSTSRGVIKRATRPVVVVREVAGRD